jgi:hypothetical protein
MKVSLPTLLSVFLFACATRHEIEAEMVDASLVKIDIIYRYPNIQQKMLTWRAENHGELVTFEPLSTNISLGYRTKAMVARRW